MNKLDLEANEKISTMWDNMSEWYEQNAERYTAQGLAQLIAMSSLYDETKPQRVLEVACGPGKHSNLIAQSYLRPDSSVLVSCDYSNTMV